MHKAVRNVTRLLERIKDYEKRIVQRRGQLSGEDYEALLERSDPAGAGPSRPSRRTSRRSCLIALGRDASVGFPAGGEPISLP